MTILEKDFVGRINNRKQTSERVKDDTGDEYGMNLKKHVFYIYLILFF
jgi:hypothetical protein